MHVRAKIVHGRGEDGRDKDEYVLDTSYLNNADAGGLIELFEDRPKAKGNNR